MSQFRIAVAALLLLVVPVVFAAGVNPENLEKYGKGIIKDYSDMKELDEIEWVWVAPGVELSKYRFEIKEVENLTALSDGDMDDVFADGFPKTMKKAGAKDENAPVLKVDGAVYWAQRANRAKWWIPYAGLHLAQAGVGIELVFTNDQGEIVAKFRHSGREGDNLENAAEELVDDVAQFVRSH